MYCYKSSNFDKSDSHTYVHIFGVVSKLSISCRGPSNTHSYSPCSVEVPQLSTLSLHIRWRSLKLPHYLFISDDVPQTSTLSLHIRWRSLKHPHYLSVSDGGPSNIHAISSYQTDVPQTSTLSLHIRWRSLKHPHSFSPSSM